MFSKNVMISIVDTSLYTYTTPQRPKRNIELMNTIMMTIYLITRLMIVIMYLRGQLHQGNKNKENITNIRHLLVAS